LPVTLHTRCNIYALDMFVYPPFQHSTNLRYNTSLKFHTHLFHYSCPVSSLHAHISVITNIFTSRRYAGAMYAMAQCLTVRLSAFYQNG